MTTRTIRRRVSRKGLTPYKLHELLHGQTVYPLVRYDGYGDPKSDFTDMEHFDLDAMRADWKANRDDILPIWIRGDGNWIELTGRTTPPWLCTGNGRAGERPWAWRRFDAPGDLEEYSILPDDLLLPGEAELIEARDKEHKAAVRERRKQERRFAKGTV